VSNRLPSVQKSGSIGEPEVPVGGLASAVFAALRRFPGSCWFGWSGRVAEPGRETRVATRSALGVKFAGLALTQAEVDDYYAGFCNRTLWPLFHCFQGRVRITPRQEACYRRVQSRFARALFPLLAEDDLIWVHDYHLMLLGRELRHLGWQGRIGFFLHTPFPPHDLWRLLPDPRDFLSALLEYDLVGFHVESFLENYVTCCRREFGARWDGTTVTVDERSQRAGAYPVGIEPADFAPRPEADAMPWRAATTTSSRRRRIVLAVDRLDYTKGIPERFVAFEEFLRKYEAWRRRVVLVQIASPSRTQVPEYVEQRRRVEAVLGRVNGELAETDWTPIRYLYRNYPRRFLASLYRRSDVGLVTPLRDGMNLVAKEYVAAQDPMDPGVLVLSRCAGAAEELKEALIVNPYVPVDVARGIARALAMSVEERRDRHARLLKRVQTGTANEWGAGILRDLEATEPVALSGGRLAPGGNEFSWGLR
jgi:trehalose 6-phosphate synthase